ncbi:hypothetical protein GC105_09190 [Alkalibaculum sp. M08DMB]|uniref:Uncharacterized protein n=1 Tax=Alkalibaculum sporogenes TaxID=2655001 RepID=A0A6A7K966_9FIRM|nr:hypothetical protein [Alkalibaculum sporogenes]MPW25964.1 hypothetical protein [Alkalibaculum sporogenes]
MSKIGTNINDLIDQATYRAIKLYTKEQATAQNKSVLHNTKLLLKHYNDLQEHALKAVETINAIDFDNIAIDEMDKDDLYILSIKKSKVKTIIMIAHIDAALASLKHKQIKLHMPEKYEALEMFYIKGIPYDDIVMKYNCGANTPRRWMGQMLNELSILLFGIDGIRDMV